MNNLHESCELFILRKLRKGEVIALNEKIIVWLSRNNNNIFKSLFGFWFLISSYFLFPIPQALSLSKSLNIYPHTIAYYMGILMFLVAIAFIRRIPVNTSPFIFLVFNIILAILFSKVKVVNINYFGDSILRSIASFASLAFIRHARKISNVLRIYKGKEEINQITIYPNDIQKKVTKGIYRYTTSDKEFWIKCQDDTATIEYICSFCILFFVFIIPNEYLGYSTIFVSIISMYRLVKHKWVLVDKDGKIV